MLAPSLSKCGHMIPMIGCDLFQNLILYLNKISLSGTINSETER